MSKGSNQHTRSNTSDADRKQRKLSEFTHCPECGLVVREGRWVKGTPPADAKTHLCPACERIKSENPAGFVYLGGEFFNEHKIEIMKKISILAEAHRNEHPLSRVMATQSTAEGALLTTTDMRLARTLGEAVHHAYQGTIEFVHGGGVGGEPITVTWKR